LKTLVVRLDHLGDLLLTTPLVRALAQGGHKVDVLARRALLPILQNSPHVATAFDIESVAPRFPNNWRQLGRWMRERSYDVIILAYAKEKRLCFASAFSGARRRIAMWGGMWARLTLHQCLRSDIHADPRPFSEILLRCADAVGIPRAGLKPDLFLTQAERAAARASLPESFRNRPLIGVHPGSAGNACNLPTEVYAEVAGAILEKTNCALVVTGTEAERMLLAQWPLKILNSERLWNSMGTLHLRELAAVIGEMNVYVCSSTGPLHLASALAVPTVSPFCPASPLCAAIWGNQGGPAHVIEPATCPRQTEASVLCCDFRGEISTSQMCAAITQLAAAGGKSGR
jgi:ADP-heptose:LPS heptosyltransferase